MVVWGGLDRVLLGVGLDQCYSIHRLRAPGLDDLWRLLLALLLCGGPFMPFLILLFGLPSIDASLADDPLSGLGCLPCKQRVRLLFAKTRASPQSRERTEQNESCFESQ